MRRSVLCSAALALLLGLAACGGDDGGVEPPPPPRVEFVPAPGPITIGTFEDFVFAANLKNAESDSAHLYVDDELLARVVGGDDSPTFPFQRAEEGQMEVRVVVFVGGRSFSGEWQVTVSSEAVPLPPSVDALEVEPGESPGTLAVTWFAPGESRYVVPLADYRVAWSSVPISEEAFDALPFVDVPHRSDVITQRTQIGGLGERELYHVAVRTRDVLGRVGAPTPSLSSESTGHYDVSGVVRSVDLNPDVGVRLLPNVLLEIDGRKVLSGGDGTYSLLNLPDLSPQVLFAEEESGAIYYAVATPPLEPRSRSLDLLLFPRGIVELETSGGEPEVLTTLEYLEVMTKNNNPADRDRGFHPWESYPIRLYVHPYVYEPAGVDYALAFSRAAANWNEAIGEEVFLVETVSTPPSNFDQGSGVFYSPDLSAGASNLGQVDVVRPQAGELYQMTPVWLVVRLRNNFFSQEIADYVITHELGHTLGLDHSPSLNDIMYFAVNTARGDLPSPDEAFVARFLRHVGQGIESTWYVVPGSSRR